MPVINCIFLSIIRGTPCNVRVDFPKKQIFILNKTISYTTVQINIKIESKYFC